MNRQHDRSFRFLSLIAVAFISIAAMSVLAQDQPPQPAPGGGGGAGFGAGPGGGFGRGGGPGPGGRGGAFNNPGGPNEGFAQEGGPQGGPAGRGGRGMGGGRGGAGAGVSQTVQQYDVLRAYIDTVDRFSKLAQDPQASGVAAVVAASDILRQRGPQGAIDYFTKTLPEVKDPAVRRAIRIQLVDLYKVSNQTEKALEQLDLLIKNPPTTAPAQ